ncbi:hypothetical protein BaRGS_00032421, partial [Batillaria attramentaria]
QVRFVGKKVWSFLYPALLLVLKALQRYLSLADQFRQRPLGKVELALPPPLPAAEDDLPPPPPSLLAEYPTEADVDPTLAPSTSPLGSLNPRSRTGPSVDGGRAENHHHSRHCKRHGCL